MQRITGRGEVTTANTKPPRRVLLTRPLTSHYDDYAANLFLCWQMLTRDHDVAEIVAATGLPEPLVSRLADRFLATS